MFPYLCIRKGNYSVIIIYRPLNPVHIELDHPQVSNANANATVAPKESLPTLRALSSPLHISHVDAVEARALLVWPIWRVPGGHKAGLPKALTPEKRKESS